MIVFLKLKPIDLFLFSMLIIAGILFLFIPFFQQKKIFSWAFVFFATYFVGVTLIGYQVWGDKNYLHFNALNDLNALLKEINASKNISQSEILNKFEKLENKINFSHYALSHLALCYQELTFYDKAISVFERASVLNPSEIEYQVQRIYTYSLKYEGKLNDEIRNDAQNLLLKDPNQKIIINLLAIDDYLNQRYQNAITRWDYLLKTDDTLSLEQKISFQAAIQTAKNHLQSQTIES